MKMFNKGMLKHVEVIFLE